MRFVRVGPGNVVGHDRPSVTPDVELLRVILKHELRDWLSFGVNGSF